MVFTVRSLMAVRVALINIKERVQGIMAETINIAKMAEKLSTGIFKEFLWGSHGAHQHQLAV